MRWRITAASAWAEIDAEIVASQRGQELIIDI
jgi:hypothetical protein